MALADTGKLDNLFYTITAYDPKRRRDATAALATLLEAGWTAEEAYHVLRLADDQSQEARFGWPDGTVLCGEGGL